MIHGTLTRLQRAHAGHTQIGAVNSVRLAPHSMPGLDVGRKNACRKTPENQTRTMVRLADIQKQADELSREDRAGLLAHLLHTLEDAPQGPDDQEVVERDSDLEAGKTPAVSHEEFVREARSGRR